VLLEKPSVSNATEAELLFRSPLLRAPNAPVLLEAFHYRFEPYWTAFLALLDKPNVTRAKVTMNVPQSFTDKKDLQFRYEVSGGALMDLTYSISLLRDIFGAKPLQCTSCKVKRMLPPSDELCDYGYDATWLFPNGGVGRAAEVLKGTMGWTLRTSLFEEEAWASEAPDDPERGAPMGHASVMHREMVLPDESLPEEQEKVMTREVRMRNYIWGCIWHRIDVDDWYIVRNKADGTVVKRWVERGTKKAYTLREAGIDRDSEPYWMSYKYQLDEFVNRVRGRDGTGVWVSGEDSINQMKMIDMAYEKAGLPVRPTTTFRLDLSGGDD
jgi:predicted dehydrogenase